MVTIKAKNEKGKISSPQLTYAFLMMPMIPVIMRVAECKRAETGEGSSIASSKFNEIIPMESKNIIEINYLAIIMDVES